MVRNKNTRITDYGQTDESAEPRNKKKKFIVISLFYHAMAETVSKELL
jgi:hypothetical protein